MCDPADQPVTRMQVEFYENGTRCTVRDAQGQEIVQIISDSPMSISHIGGVPIWISGHAVCQPVDAGCEVAGVRIDTLNGQP